MRTITSDFEALCAQRDQLLDKWLGTFLGAERERKTQAMAWYLVTGDYEQEIPSQLVKLQRLVMEALDG